jgi:hypothetical protein
LNDDSYIRVDNLKIRQIIHEYESGRIAIPEFQRGYVWKPKKAAKLIESLYRRYPVASLLLWQSSEETRARSDKPRYSPSSVRWLIDGQQRVRTLASALKADPALEVVFNPSTEEFQSASAATRKDPNWLDVARICDDSDHLIRQPSGEGRAAQQRSLRIERVRRILDYEVPAIVMVDHEFADAVEAFTRINTLGVRLKKGDIDSARVAAKHTGLIADEVVPFLDNLRRQNFERLNVMHLFRACAFVAQPDGRNRTPLQELSERSVRDAWKKTKRATEQTLELVRSELGLSNMSILWSGALLVPLIALNAAIPPRERNDRELIGWLALAALFHRYSKASETALDQDLRACRNNDPIGALLSNLRALRPSLLAQPSDFRTAIADRSAMLAMYIACRHRGMQDLLSGGAMTMRNMIDRHHILPRGQFSQSARTKADTIANIAFVSDSTNRSINVTSPEVYLAKVGSKILESQCVPSDRSLWVISRAEEFWEARRVMLAEAFNRYMKDMMPGRRLT